jgi:hypothetical protein
MLDELWIIPKYKPVILEIKKNFTSTLQLRAPARQLRGEGSEAALFAPLGAKFLHSYSFLTYEFFIYF